MEIPQQKQIGDAPLYLRIVHGYDTTGRLVKTAFFDSDGKPGYYYQMWPYRDFPGDLPVFSSVTYTYDDKGQPHWTVYHADGTPFPPPKPRASSPTPGPQPSETRDSHGNLIRSEYQGFVTEWEIAYY